MTFLLNPFLQKDLESKLVHQQHVRLRDQEYFEFLYCRIGTTQTNPHRHFL